jgi:hypothetical protein
LHFFQNERRVCDRQLEIAALTAKLEASHPKVRCLPLPKSSIID